MNTTNILGINRIALLYIVVNLLATMDSLEFIQIIIPQLQNDTMKIN